MKQKLPIEMTENGMPFEDMALYRAIPGATVMDVTDAATLEDVLALGGQNVRGL